MKKFNFNPIVVCWAWKFNEIKKKRSLTKLQNNKINEINLPVYIKNNKRKKKK